MIDRLKSITKGLIAKITPNHFRKSLLAIWQQDDEFRLHCMIATNGNEILFKNRFVWSDIRMPLKNIRERFGGNCTIYLLSDRPDNPVELNLIQIEISAIDNFNPDKINVVILAYESDEELFKSVQLINSKPNIFYFSPFRYLPTAQYFHRNNIARSVLINELKLNLGKFDLADFENIIQALEITRDLDGDYVEIGVYKGDSAHLACEYMKVSGINRRAYFFDLFDGFINESSNLSNDAVWWGSHTETSFDYVKNLLFGFDNICINKLDIIINDLPDVIKQIALCNIDVDMYEAVKAALEKVSPLIEKGGIIILEDQGHTPFLAGAYTATNEFIRSNSAEYTPIHMRSGQMLLIKQ